VVIYAVIGLLILLTGVLLAYSAGFMRDLAWPGRRRYPKPGRGWRPQGTSHFARWTLLIVFCVFCAAAGLLLGTYVSPGPSTFVGAAVQTVTVHHHQGPITTTVTTTKTIKRNGKTLTVPVTTTRVVPTAITTTRTNTLAVNHTDTVNHTVNQTVTSTVTVPVTSTITETVTETVTQTTPPTT
jgi:hypothetical protein